MEEKEQLRRQIRLLQGLIDDYKHLHGDAPAPGTAAPARWQPPPCGGHRAFGARYPRPSRRAAAPSRGPEWRRKYSLVNRPPGPAEPPPRPSGAPPGPDPQPQPQPCVLERQVQLSPDRNMVIRIKPTSKPGSASGAGVPRGFPEGDREPPRTDRRPQEGEGEPPGGQRQSSRPAHARGSGGAEDPVPVWRKEPGRPRAVRAAGSAGSVGSAGDGAPAPRRTVSESALALQARSPPASPSPRGGSALGRKGAPLLAGGAVPPAPGDGRPGCPDPLASSGPGAAPARLAPGPRQAREAARLGLCRASRFRRSNYKWVAASAKGPRAARRASSPRAAAEGAARTPVGPAEPAEKPQPGRSVDPAAPPGAAPGSKYRWKAAGASFRWPADAGSRDRASLLAPVPPRCPAGARPAAEPGGSKPAAGETSASAYKVRSRTKIVRRRSGASGPADRKSSPPPPAAATARSQFSLRRPGRSGSAPRKTPQKALLPGARHRPYCPPPGRAAPPSREAPSPLAPRTPPAGKVIKTRYRIVKKTPAAPPPAPPGPPATPSWRTRRPPLSRSLVLSRPRPTAGAARALPGPPGPPSWRGRGYRCIGGVLYRVSANKLSKTGGRPLPRAGRVEPGGSCSRALASRAVQRSLAIVRQARQRRRRREAEYCMYYNRFGRCHRGARCPYIHDPEKVAVCTRFVRGTCKKTDGTCPFSHHVSKEKMPVCSYFLRGVCSNSDCPYSHVYVSRKAAVCTDFLRGYCPLGAKCKKKHTLCCPDFSRRGACPRGARCQLLHRGQTRPCRRAAPAPEPSSTPPRSGASAGRAARKSSAAQRPAGRPSPPAPARSASGAPRDPGPPQEASPGPLKASGPPSPSSSAGSSGSSPAASPAPPASPALRRDPRDEAAPGPARLPRLPSFISLRCTPSPGAPPPARRPRSPARQDSGPPLHIKPRL